MPFSGFRSDCLGAKKDPMISVVNTATDIAAAVTKISNKAVAKINSIYDKEPEKLGETNVSSITTP